MLQCQVAKLKVPEIIEEIRSIGKMGTRERILGVAILLPGSPVASLAARKRGLGCNTTLITFEA